MGHGVDGGDQGASSAVGESRGAAAVTVIRLGCVDREELGVGEGTACQGAVKGGRPAGTGQGWT